MSKTKVSLKSLQSAKQLERIGVSNYVEHVWNDDRMIFTVTFNLAYGFMQDIVINFSESRPNVYISDAYILNNAEHEITDSLAIEKFEKLISNRKAKLNNIPLFFENDRDALEMEIESYRKSIRAIEDIRTINEKKAVDF